MDTISSVQNVGDTDFLNVLSVLSIYIKQEIINIITHYSYSMMVIIEIYPAIFHTYIGGML